MKKILLGTVALATFSLAQGVQAQEYNSQDNYNYGPYIGAYGGYGWSDLEVNGATDPDFSGGDYGVYVGFQADSLLDATINRTGLGLTGAIEAHYGWSDQDDTVGAVSIEKDNEWGINFRPGLKFLNNDAIVDVAPYAIIGYRRTNFDATVGAVSADEDYNGFELGIGTELIAYDNIGVRLDYTHVWYGEKNGIDPDEDNVRIGVGYKF